ncbi:DUF554 domain-containing protein [Clostridium sp. CTA-5]
MPLGVFIDCLCILVGGTIGAYLKNKVPTRIIEPLNVIFGISAIAIGIVAFIKLNSLPTVILSIILGTLIGEYLNLEDKIKSLFQNVLNKLNFKIPNNINSDDYMKFYLIVAVTFCASGTNIFGAINEGLTGDMTILISKATMDIFASFIFATTLGYAMNIIVIPQLIFLSLCFYSSHIIMPFITQSMLADFVSVGGLMTFILGLSIAKIKSVSAVNLLPSLLIVLPVSYLFSILL